MQKILIALLLFIPLGLLPAFMQAQRTVPPTDTLRISGEIETELTFTLSDLDTFPTEAIGDITLTNQKGEVKSTLHGLRGIPVKMLLGKAAMKIEKPRELNEFYFVLTASDGYIAVFSWNELFNTEVGNYVYIVTEQDGHKLREMGERIVLVSTSDLKVGPRYVKGLARISIERVGGR